MKDEWLDTDSGEVRWIATHECGMLNDERERRRMNGNDEVGKVKHE